MGKIMDPHIFLLLSVHYTPNSRHSLEPIILIYWLKSCVLLLWLYIFWISMLWTQPLLFIMVTINKLKHFLNLITLLPFSFKSTRSLYSNRFISKPIILFAIANPFWPKPRIPTVLLEMPWPTIQVGWFISHLSLSTNNKYKFHNCENKD